MWNEQDKIKVYNMVLGYRKQLIEHGMKVYPIVKVKFGHAIKTWGSCTTYSDNTCVITISEICLHSKDLALKTTILHELCHAMPYTEGHDSQWYRYAYKVNKLFDVDITKYVKQEFSAASKEYKETRYKWQVSCPCCGNTWKKYRKTNLVKFALDERTNHKYRCKCGNNKFTVKDLTNNIEYVRLTVKG